MTPQEINNLSYTDFAGYINQWNVLPGSYDTLNRWRVYSNITKDSRVLEVACTTGFSAREISLMTGCSSHGIDISESSIKSAINNKKQYADDCNLTYEVGDGLKFESFHSYTHVIIGASLKFFNNPEIMVNKINSLLDDGGYLLASPFYTVKEIPQELVAKARSVFGITITTESYKDIIWMYKDFEILYQEKKSLDQETAQELHHYCKSTMDLFKEKKPGLSDDVYSAAYNRLYKIKEMSNDLRPYQGYTVLVLRCRKNLFGKRLVELF